MRKAVVRTTDGFVTNIIEIKKNANWQLPEGFYLIAAGKGSPGDTWDGKKFVKPELPTPEPPRVPLTEIDEIKAKIADYDTLKARVETLEKK